MDCKAVIFDLDNTLIYIPPEFTSELIRRVLNEFNVTVSDDDINRFWFGCDRDEIIRDYFRVEPELFWKVYEKYDTVELRRKYAAVYIDVKFIFELKKKRYKLGVLTSAPTHIMDYEISMIGRENFDSIISTPPSFNPELKQKPNPGGLELCLAELKVDKEEALVVGDTDNDLIMARNAHVPSFLLVRKDEMERHKHLREIPSLMGYNLYTLRRIIE